MIIQFFNQGNGLSMRYTHITNIISRRRVELLLVLSLLVVEADHRA